MAYSTINKPSLHFNTVTYTGNGSTQSITGVNFQPDWVWIKDRGPDGDNHQLYDAVRTATKSIQSNNTNAELTFASGLTAFDSDGFSLGSDDQHNGSSDPFVAWNWLADNTSGSSNTDGSITSTVSANTTAGFSIVKYTGNGNASTQTVGHGLGSKCKLVMLKNLSDAEGWRVYHDTVSASAGGNLFLNATSTLNTSDPARITATSTSTFTLTGYTSTYDAVNKSGSNYIAYCFSEVKAYSKFGSYLGNGNADGTFVYTGFRPAFVLFKDSSTAYDWMMFDNKRNGYNPNNDDLEPSNSSAESNTDKLDILSNGFKLRKADADANASGDTFIYIAFAEQPLVGTNNVCATAR